MEWILTLLISFSFSQPQIWAERDLLKKMDAHQFASEMIEYEDTTFTFDVLHYRIEMGVDISNDTIWATANLRILSRTDTLTQLPIHFVGLTVESVLVNNVSRDFWRVDSILYIDLGGQVTSGETLDVSVIYHGYPTTGGGVFGGGLTIYSYIAYADNEPWGAKRWYPCHDNPADKATSELIVTVPSGFYVVANGTLVDSSTTGDWWTFHWVENHPIATYLIVFAARDFARIDTFWTYEGDTMPLIHWVRHSDSTAACSEFARTPDMLTFFSDTFGVYPFKDEKYSHVQVPIGGAMENQTNTFYGFSIFGGNSHDWVIAHELSHQWWGDAITLGTWADIWLNEGFATYCEALYIGHRDGGTAYHDYMVDNIMNYYLYYAPYPPYPIYNPDHLFSVVTYEKAASVLHMLRHVIGDSVFFDALKTYYESFVYGNAVTEEFQQVVEDVAGEDLDWFFDEWIYLPGHPHYRFSWWTYPVGSDSFGLVLQIQQIQSHSYGVPTFRMPIDIEVVFADGDTLLTVVDSLDDQLFTFYFDREPINLIFDPGDWILKEVEEVSVEEAQTNPRVAGLDIWGISTSLRMRLAIKEEGVYSLDLYRINGSRVAHVYLGRLKRGIYSYTLPTLKAGNLRNGVYFAILRGGNSILKRKFIYIR